MNFESCFHRAAKTLSSLFFPLPEHSLLCARPDENLKLLDATMHRIQALIRDSEENQSSTTMHTERLRLNELRGVAYDADDMLDVYAYHVLWDQIQALDGTEAGPSTRKRKLAGDELVPHSITSPACVPIPKPIVDNAEKILKECDSINSQWDNFQLWGIDGDMRNGVDKKKVIATSSFVHKADIFGRVEDKKKVIEMLFTENSAELCNVSVLPIVGMAGVGKTTLAQLVHNDPRVRESFDLHGWVFVGGNFDVVTLTRKIIGTFIGKNCDLTELNELQKKLEEVVRGKRFFLVLDDISNDTTSAWGTLLAPLVRSQSGRIVVTAHDKQVAKIRQKRSSYSLGYLPYEDCWSLFKNLVFEGKEYPHPELRKIGGSIVAKCKGLPLAVKAIGTALYSENDEEKWNDMLTRNIWELAESRDLIFEAMKLSYHRMPIHLKRCFVLFSLFPKGHVFSKDKMIRLWMSLGLLEESREMEYFGKRCIGELLRFSMIQNHEDNETLEVFFLHDFVQSLAQLVAGDDFMIMDENFLNGMKDELFEMENGISTNLHKKRYLSMIHSLANSIGLQILNKSKKLRILQLLGFNNHYMDIRIPNELFQNLTHLRALDFGNCVMRTLPESIGNLIQLRYLVLTNTGIERLPEAVCHLYYLQTLDLKGCPIQELPEGMKYLVKLRHLNFENWHYIHMPRGIGRLKALRTLPRFDISKGSWHCELSELNELVNLEGELCIGGLQNVALVGNTVKISEKVNILRLDWSSGEHGQDKYDVASICTRSGSTSSNPLPDHADPKIHDHVFEMLKSNCSILKELHIHKYCGSVFPSWLGDASFTNLEKISLVGVHGCSRLPTLGQLQSLKTLLIQSMWSVEQVGPEFYCFRGTPVFPALEYLEFSDLLNWCNWHAVKNVNFISLKILRIIDCPKLTSLPQTLSSSLTKLVIKDCEKLIPSRAFHSLKSLTLKGELNQDFFSFLDSPSLRTLKVSHSSNITSIRFGYQKLLSLEVLVIQSCRNLKLVSGFGDINSLKLFKICTCRKVKFPLTEEIPPLLQHLDISSCPMLKGWEQFHKRKLIFQLNNDRGAEYEELEALAELSEAESEDDSDADDSQ